MPFKDSASFSQGKRAQPSGSTAAFNPRSLQAEFGNMACECFKKSPPQIPYHISHSHPSMATYNRIYKKQKNKNKQKPSSLFFQLEVSGQKHRVSHLCSRSVIVCCLLLSSKYVYFSNSSFFTPRYVGQGAYILFKIFLGCVYVHQSLRTTAILDALQEKTTFR